MDNKTLYRMNVYFIDPIGFTPTQLRLKAMAVNEAEAKQKAIEMVLRGRPKMDTSTISISFVNKTAWRNKRYRIW